MTDKILTDLLPAVHARSRSAARWLQVAGYRPDQFNWRIGTMHPA